MNELLQNIDRLHTTEMAIDRIKNHSLDAKDVIAWCKTKIIKESTHIERKDKNWYVYIDQCIITVNAGSYTIITAHKQKMHLR